MLVASPPAAPPSYRGSCCWGSCSLGGRCWGGVKFVRFRLKCCITTAAVQRRATGHIGATAPCLCWGSCCWSDRCWGGRCWGGRCPTREVRFRLECSIDTIDCPQRRCNFGVSRTHACLLFGCRAHRTPTRLRRNFYRGATETRHPRSETRRGATRRDGWCCLIELPPELPRRHH